MALDAILQAFVTVNSLAASPYVLLVLGFVGSYLGIRAVEVIPYTRRIIERRDAQAAAAERE